MNLYRQQKPRQEVYEGLCQIQELQKVKDGGIKGTDMHGSQIQRMNGPCANRLRKEETKKLVAMEKPDIYKRWRPSMECVMCRGKERHAKTSVHRRHVDANGVTGSSGVCMTYPVGRQEDSIGVELR